MLRCDRISSSNARKPACEYDSGNFIEQAIIYLHAHKQKHTHSYRRLRIYFNMISIPYFFLHTLSPTFPRPCIRSVYFSYLSLFHSVSLSFKRSFRFTLYKSSFFLRLISTVSPLICLSLYSFFLPCPLNASMPQSDNHPTYMEEHNSFSCFRIPFFCFSFIPFFSPFSTSPLFVSLSIACNYSHFNYSCVGAFSVASKYQLPLFFDGGLHIFDSSYHARTLRPRTFSIKS